MKPSKLYEALHALIGERVPLMAMRDAAARDTAITHTPEFVRFGVDYREVIR